MPDICGVCSTAVSRSNPGVKCYGQCELKYHLKCVGLPQSFADLTADSGVRWTCTRCGSSAKTGIEKQLLTKLDDIQGHIKGLKTEQSEFKKSLNFYGNKIDEFNKQIENFQTLVRTIDIMREEMSSVRSECKGLRNEIEILQQMGRINNLEICGIPEKRNEDIPSIIRRIATKLDVTVEEQHIDDAHRVSIFSDNNSNKHKNIVVKFSSRLIKNTFLNAARKFNRKFNCSDLGFTEDSLVYVNEHLSPFYKLLFKKAREFCRLHSYKYCWIRDTKIFIKKSDDGRTIYVSNEDVLTRLVA